MGRTTQSGLVGTCSIVNYTSIVYKAKHILCKSMSMCMCILHGYLIESFDFFYPPPLKFCCVCMWVWIYMCMCKRPIYVI